MGNWACKRQEKKIMIQGLDAAGKTSLLYRLKLGEVVTTIPTIGFNVETVEANGIFITCWDVGGRDKIRPLFRHYYPNTHGYVFVIDSNDRERLDDALDQLVSLVFLEELTEGSVVMILANKQDLEGSLTPSEIEYALCKKYKFSRDSAGNHTVFIRPCSVLTGDGIMEAFGEFAEMIVLKEKGRLFSGFLLHVEVTNNQEDKKSVLAESERAKESLAVVGLKTFLKDPLSYLKTLF